MWKPKGKRTPDFNQLLVVLEKKRPLRPILWEFYLNERLYGVLCEGHKLPQEEYLRAIVVNIVSYQKAGYDYAMLPPPPDFNFSTGNRDKGEARSVSMSHGGAIKTLKDFDAFEWPDINKADLSSWDALASYLPSGMKMIPHGPDGVEESVINLMGYENLCFAMADEPELVKLEFDKFGQILVDYYTLVCSYPFVGAAMSNDDWGFNTSTLLSDDQMEEYLYPWHRKITEVIHKAGHPALLHSCGKMSPKVMDVIINDIGYDAKHSFEDIIRPVEQVYQEYQGKIALLGGVDVDFMTRSSEKEVYNRSIKLLEMSAEKGGYALGTGNSVPDYIPDEKYFAMIQAAWDFL